MAIHTPLTTNVRAAYVSSQDFFIEDDEEVYAPRRSTYEDRALGFDQWLNSIIAVAKAQGFAEGKAAAVADIATGETSKPQNSTLASFDIWLDKCIEKIMADELAKGNAVTKAEARLILNKSLTV